MTIIEHPGLSLMGVILNILLFSYIWRTFGSMERNNCSKIKAAFCFALTSWSLISPLKPPLVVAKDRRTPSVATLPLHSSTSQLNSDSSVWN